LRQTAALFAFALLLVLPGCGTAERERDVSSVTERFHAALGQEDGAAACALLTEETASKLEGQEKRPCDQAILDLELAKGGTVDETRVEVTSAIATLAEGGSAFLDEGPDGWRVAAAGCTPTAPNQPYECELEG
jgi:hypothetical protein